MDETRCIETVPGAGQWGYFHLHQCCRKRGFGPNGQYCKQHDPERVKQKREKRYTSWRDKNACEAKERERMQTALKLVAGIPTEEIKNYKLVKIEE